MPGTPARSIQGRTHSSAPRSVATRGSLGHDGFDYQPSALRALRATPDEASGAPRACGRNFLIDPGFEL